METSSVTTERPSAVMINEVGRKSRKTNREHISITRQGPRNGPDGKTLTDQDKVYPLLES